MSETNATTGPADELREAARLMRERAGKATPGPWAAHPDGLVWAQRLGDPVSGSTEVEDAQHIASMHPAVALAVADLLDTYAEYDWSDERHRAALAVARAYLGTSVEAVSRG